VTNRQRDDDGIMAYKLTALSWRRAIKNNEILLFFIYLWQINDDEITKEKYDYYDDHKKSSKSDSQVVEA